VVRGGDLRNREVNMPDPSGDARLQNLRRLGLLLRGHIGKYRDVRLQDLATAALRDPSGRGAQVVSIVNATIQVRQAINHALHLEPRRLVSRAGFVLGSRTAEPVAEPVALTLLCPTRERPQRMAAFLRSIDRTVHVGGRVEILCYVDSDDPCLSDYQRLAERAAERFPRIGRVLLHVGEPVGVPTTWNVLAEAATGDYLLMANDDQLYVTYGWDTALDRVVARLRPRHPDGVLCLYFEADQYPEGGYDFPIISREWYAALGYYVPTIFQQWQAEKWIFDLAERIERLEPVTGVFVEHLHYQDYKAPFDTTYQRHRMTREMSFADHALFLRTEHDREQAAQTLRRAIEARTPSKPSEETDMGDEHSPAPAGADTGTRSYITQMARRHFGNIIDVWNYGGRTDAARECAELAVKQGVWPNPLQRAREFVPGLESKPVHDSSSLWFTGYLEEQYPQIRAEIEAVLDTAGDPVKPTVEDGAGLIHRGTWKQGHLFKDGQWQDEVCEHFPVTTSILKEIPEVTTLGPGVIMISRLTPGTHITPHCGPTNAVLRIHLPIKVPPGAAIRVGEEWLEWSEGKCLVFDDSYEHEVRHDGDTDRIVLILDALHPDLQGRHEERLRQRRLTFEEQIVAFMRERGLERIDVRDGEPTFYPDAATRDLASVYMNHTGIVGAELDGDTVVWHRRGAEKE
jgi:aspartyl/asparaginyl beta-hydroxylase (cupin superfamily)